MSLIKRQKEIMDCLQRCYAGIITHGDTIDDLNANASPGFVMEEVEKALVGISEAQTNLTMAKMYAEALLNEARKAGE